MYFWNELEKKFNDLDKTLHECQIFEVKIFETEKKHTWHVFDKLQVASKYILASSSYENIFLNISNVKLMYWNMCSKGGTLRGTEYL